MKKTILVLAIAGCMGGTEDQGPVERVQSALLFFDPLGNAAIYQQLVGRGLNGRSWNMDVLDGRLVVAVSLKGVRFDKGPAKNLKLDGTKFKGAKDAVGATFTAKLDNGATLPLQVFGVTTRGSPKAAYDAYEVRYPADGEWKPLCGLDEAGAPVLAIPLAGRWDYQEGVPTGGAHIEEPDVFTFACEDRVLAKCVAMGYAPWLEGFICDTGKKACTKTTLAPWHQACTRAMRADYCGDGTSYTLDGEWTLVYDGVGIRYDTEDWVLEAEWDEDGARCLSHVRLATLGQVHCADRLVSEVCGEMSHFESGTLLMTEVPE